MTKYILLLYFFTWQLSLASDKCLNIEAPTKEATEKVISDKYPYWYNLALAKKETNCRWLTSLDGHGSVGYFQLTPKFLDPILRPLYPDYTKPYSKDHFYAFAYYVKSLHISNPSNKLFITYQRYNGGDWVLKECKRAGTYEWDKCKQTCMRGKVCVRKINGECTQYRSACDINYSYSLLIYEYGQRYKKGIDLLQFW
jgi:hypothetical protein